MEAYHADMPSGPDWGEVIWTWEGETGEWYVVHGDVDGQFYVEITPWGESGIEEFTVPHPSPLSAMWFAINTDSEAAEAADEAERAYDRAMADSMYYDDPADRPVEELPE